ncbi:MAG TPA: pyridoxamine 5'-phosphate oxidase family protein, partial [Chitinophagaceae bacterium]
MQPPVITEEMMPSLQGVIPALIASCSAEGIPNVTYISQVFYVDQHHVALSRQFFNKTVRNVTENPVATVLVTCPINLFVYKLHLEFRESQTEGEVFTNMRLQLEVIAGMQGQSDNFKLMAADIYSVKGI